jgi:hypothetical protein
MYKSWHVQTIQPERAKSARAHLDSDVLRNDHAILPKREHAHVAPQMRRALLRCTCTSLLVLCQIANLAIAIWALCPLFACCLLFFAFFCYLSFSFVFCSFIFFVSFVVFSLVGKTESYTVSTFPIGIGRVPELLTLKTTII